MSEETISRKQKNKELLGEVQTSQTLIDAILDLVPPATYADPTLKWLDPCCGDGRFAKSVFIRLFDSLSESIPSPAERKRHILRDMLFMVEINHEHLPELRSTFGDDANIIHADFLSAGLPAVDVVVGNPPFTVAGSVKVPTNTKDNKRGDGFAVWGVFVRKCISCLSPNGLLAMITPSIWMKRDHNMHNSILQHDISGLHAMTNTETNRIIRGQAQTPTCYFLLQKRPSTGSKRCRRVGLFDKKLGRVVSYRYTLDPPVSLPVFAASIASKLQSFVKKAGPIAVKKTNMPRKGTHLSQTPDAMHKHVNIRTCILRDSQPVLKLEYSDKLCAFAGQKKLILAHKMYGFPFLDEDGKFGISNRDNYVILGPLDRLRRLSDLLSTKFAMYLFESTRYRMKYLERYAFELMPDVTELDEFPSEITDKTVANYFKFTAAERNAIQSFQKKTYFKSILPLIKIDTDL